MNTLIIIPTYNESANIVALITQLIATVANADILVVDDNSPDGTSEIARTFAAASQRNIQVILRENERGLGMAYKAGFLYGLSRGYDFLVTMDADMSHNPESLPAMLQAAQTCDMVIGSRYIEDGKTVHWEKWRVLLSWSANSFARTLLGLHGNDLTSGYRVYRRGILEKIRLDEIQSNGYSFLVELLYQVQRHHAVIREIPIVFVDRTMGTSKISKREIYRGAWTLFRLRFHLFF